MAPFTYTILILIEQVCIFKAILISVTTFRLHDLPSLAIFYKNFFSALLMLLQNKLVRLYRGIFLG